jgi:hypothetical protein
MTAAKGNPCPEAPHGAELIIKQSWEVSTRYSREVAPGVHLLGNREGFRWLSEYFAWIADRIDDNAEVAPANADDHPHLFPGAPFNSELSDEVGIMLGHFSQRHRERVLELLGCSPEARSLGSPIAQFLPVLRALTKFFGKYSLNEWGQNWRDELRLLMHEAAMCRAQFRQAEEAARDEFFGEK